MSKEKRRVPKLRFPGFTEDWEQRKLESILIEYTEKNPGNEDLPVLTSSRQGLTKQEDHFGSVQRHDISDYNVIPLGFCTYRNRSDDKTFTFNINRIVSRGLVSKFYPVFDINNGNVDFITAYLNNNIGIIKSLAVNAIGTSQVVLSLRTLRNIEVTLPSKMEQVAIGNYIRKLDIYITLHQRKLNNLKLKKKALLQKLFPKNGERYPELRFPGFTDAWEQRKLESLFTKYEDKVNTPSSGYWRLGLRSHCKGTFHTYIDAGNELETAEMNRVKSGNFILNITFAWERALAVTNDEDQDKLVSHRFPQFKPNNDLVIDFFKHTLMDKRFKHHLELSSPGGAGRNKVLKVADMLKYELLVPSIKEQNKISSFLNHVDYIITLHQRKLDHLQLQKKALLQQMFV